MHAKNLIISEELAKSGIERYLAPLARFRETRRVMNVAVVKGTAQEFIKADKSNIGESQAKAIELMAMQANNTSFFPRITFYDFYRGLLSPYEHGYAVYAGINDFKELPETPSGGEAPLIVDKGFEPGKIPRSGVASREYVGTAVFIGDKMVGSLNSEETRYFLMVKGKFKRGIIVLKDERAPDNAIPLDLRPSRKPVVKGYFKKGKPVIDIKLEMEADIGAIQSRINYENKDEIEKLNRQAEEHIQQRVINVIEKCHNEYKTDIFGFGRKFAGYFPTIQKWEEYDWLSHFSEAKVNVQVNVNIRRTGLMIESSKVRKNVGKK
jgi:spore germination protein KC